MLFIIEAKSVLQLLIATRNAHKTREFSDILGPDFFLSDLTSATAIPSVEETGSTFEQNARLKTTAVSRLRPGYVTADDSGLEVWALNGAPGVYSARYAGENACDEENIGKLLRELEATGSADRRARFRCALALARGGEVLALFHGEVEGAIATAARGANGFGYDPVFVPNGCTMTFAELGDETKNRISHRARALRQLCEKLAVLESLR